MPPEESAFIGLRDISGNNTDFRWISTNASLTFENWRPTEPNQNSQTCVIVKLTPTSSRPAGLWYDTICHGINHAVCEADRVSENL